MEIVTRHDTFKETNEEIDKFINILMKQKKLPNTSELRAITKLIIFMKTVINYKKPTHYNNCLLYDILSVMNSLTSTSIRQFHYVFRSFIENFIRSMLNLSDTDETGVNELFRRFRDTFGGSESDEIINYVYREYTNSCLYVHSNAKANVSIQVHLSEIISTNDFTPKTLVTTIIKILKTLQKMTHLIIHAYPHIVENAFYRRKQLLRYLIGHNSYLLFISKIDR